VTAFDTAWDLLKMPLIPSSLQEITSEKRPKLEGHFAPTRSYKAQFRDPVTNEILPLVVDYVNRLNSWGDQLHSYTGKIGDDKKGDRGKLRYEVPDKRQSITSVNWVSPWNLGNKAYPAWTETREGRRGRGYAPALYDVISYLMDKNQNVPLSPSTEQKASAKNMWKDRDRWPVRDDL